MNLGDRRQVGGGVLFGAGWGIAGFCPGPALVAASAGSSLALGFVAAMLMGMALHDRRLAKRGLPTAVPTPVRGQTV